MERFLQIEDDEKLAEESTRRETAQGEKNEIELARCKTGVMGSHAMRKEDG